MSSEEERGFPEGKHELSEEQVRRADSQSGTVVPKAVQERIEKTHEKSQKSSSDLDKAFSYHAEAPIQIIELPSKGFLYDGRVPDGRLEVRPLTAREEKLLAGAAGDLSDVMDTIFKRCVVLNNSMTPDDFLSSDRFFTLLMLRANSYGEEYGFSVTCDACGFDIGKTVLIPGDFEITYLEEGIKEPIEVTLPRSRKRVGFRLPRGRDEANIARYSERMLGGGRKRRNVAKQQGDPAYTYRVALLIDTLDGYDVSESRLMDRKIDFVEGLIGEDSITLQTAIRDNDCGINTEMSERCPRCNRMNQFTLPFTAEFFRPAPRRGD